jgi:hypothetical protein
VIRYKGAVLTLQLLRVRNVLQCAPMSLRWHRLAQHCCRCKQKGGSNSDCNCSSSSYAHSSSSSSSSSSNSSSIGTYAQSPCSARISKISDRCSEIHLERAAVQAARLHRPAAVLEPIQQCACRLQRLERSAMQCTLLLPVVTGSTSVYLSGDNQSTILLWFINWLYNANDGLL